MRTTASSYTLHIPAPSPSCTHRTWQVIDDEFGNMTGWWMCVECDLIIDVPAYGENASPHNAAPEASDG